MSKNIVGKIRVYIDGGKANPGKLGQVFGVKGITNHMAKFCDEFNKATKGRENELLPVYISIYDDKTISYVIKHEPVATSILKAIKVDKGSGTPNRLKKGTITMDKVKEIAEKKKDDLNAYTIDAAIKIVMGTARSIGVDVK